jgi:nucleoside-diphosphate-sugar epimerase
MRTRRKFRLETKHLRRTDKEPLRSVYTRNMTSQEKLKNVKVLVTGGAGFIGSHLVDELIKEECEVSVLDDFSTGKLENIEQNLSQAKLRLVKGDIRETQKVKKAIGDSEAVFHLAAITSVSYSVMHRDVTRDVNVNGTLNLLETSLNSSVEYFVLVSSCAVYGEAEHLPISEEEPTKPLSPYAESKLEAERQCREFYAKHGLKTTILRPFNVYGPRMRNDQYGGVIAKFIERLQSNKPPIIYGDGTQTRDFIHVQDIVSAMKMVIGNEKAAGQTFNVATGAPTTISQLVQLLTKLVGDKKIKPQYRPARQGDLKHSYANIQKATDNLGFEPKITLKQGLLNLIR